MIKRSHPSVGVMGPFGLLLLHSLAGAAATPESALPAPTHVETGTPTPGTSQPGAPQPNPSQPNPAQPSSSQPGTGENGTATSEVVIEAPEPKFVAPTRLDRIGRIWAPVLINGKGPFRFVLDTGASHSALTEGVAERLGIDPRASTSVLLHGVTGSAIVPTVQIDRLEVGELVVDSTVLPIVADVFGGVDGVLGREGLPDKRIFADFQKDRLVISRSHHEHAPVGFTTISLKLTKMGLLASDVRIGDIYAKAIIDTGAQMTVGNMALRNALMRHPPADARTEGIVGVTLEVQQGDNIPAPSISLGRLTIHGAHILFGDMRLFQHWKLTSEPALLVGMDVLGTFDVLIIDYKMRELQVRTHGR